MFVMHRFAGSGATDSISIEDTDSPAPGALLTLYHRYGNQRARSIFIPARAWNRLRAVAPPEDPEEKKHSAIGE